MTETPETAQEPSTDAADTDVTDDVVILVHGTFAADKDRNDTGNRWWQRDSATWRELEARLPEGVRLPGRRMQLFHWSGANAQSDRLHAGNRLLARLIELEQQGRGYHLVGHSHGGSVIWEALTTAAVIREKAHVDHEFWDLLTRLKLIPDVPRHSTKVRKAYARELAAIDTEVCGHLELRGLRSWTTVGTPFLRFLPSRRRLVDGWPHPGYSLADEEKPSRMRFMQGLVGTIGVLLALVGFISFVILVGSLWPGSRSSPPSGPKPYRGSLWWPLLGVAGGVIGTTMVGAAFDELAESLGVRELASRRAFARHAGCWLGIWAPTDEAISLLRTAAPGSEADYRTLFTPRAERIGHQSTSDYTLIPWKLPLRLRLPPGRVGLVPSTKSHRPGAIVKAPAYFLFNRLVAPRVRDQLSRTTVRAVQGSDIAGAELVFASPWPIPLDTPPPGLPDHVAERMEARARSSSAELIPVAREVMAQAVLGLPGVVSSLAAARATGAEGSASGGAALVHTGYFEDPFVLELVVEHIERSRGGGWEDGQGDAEPQGTGSEAGAWLEAGAAQVAERLQTLAITSATAQLTDQPGTYGSGTE